MTWTSKGRPVERQYPNGISTLANGLPAYTARDSGSDPKGEDAPAAECEASQSGPAKTGHRPNLRAVK